MAGDGTPPTDWTVDRLRTHGRQVWEARHLHATTGVAVSSGGRGSAVMIAVRLDSPAAVDAHTAAGAKVILEPAAAQFLEDKVLDVRQDDEGNPAFAIARQETSD